MNELPKIIKTGNLKLGEYDIQVCMLSNGRRIVTEKGMENFMKWIKKNPENKSPGEALRFAKKLKHFN